MESIVSGGNGPATGGLTVASVMGILNHVCYILNIDNLIRNGSLHFAYILSFLTGIICAMNRSFCFLSVMTYLNHWFHSTWCIPSGAATDLRWRNVEWNGRNSSRLVHSSTEEREVRQKRVNQPTFSRVLMIEWRWFIYQRGSYAVRSMVLGLLHSIDEKGDK